jgi:hypothetical protein
MKQVAWLGLIALVAAEAVAQQRGSFGGGPAHGGGFARGSSGSGPLRNRMGAGFRGVRPFERFHPYGSPLFDDGYGFGYPSDFDYPLSPDTMVEQPARPIIIRQAPSPVVKSVIQNFDVGAPAGADESTFVVALKDGSRVSATAVWVQGEVVHFVDTDDRSRQVPLASVERELTRKLNQQRNLNLRLPPPQ